jgi:hypothetical protein
MAGTNIQCFVQSLKKSPLQLDFLGDWPMVNKEQEPNGFCMNETGDLFCIGYCQEK